MPDPINLNPDGPHSRDHTAELGQLFDDCSRAITYATMRGNGGLEYPSDVYRLVADLYAATGRFRQMFEQIGEFLSAQADTGRLYEAQGRSIDAQVSTARVHLDQASHAAQVLTKMLQAVQVDINGLGVKEGT